MLDYLMINVFVFEWLFDVIEWYINVDEFVVLDYNIEDNGDLFINFLLYCVFDYDFVIVIFIMFSEIMVGDWDSDGDIDMIDL